MLDIYKLGQLLGMNMYVFSVHKNKIIDAYITNKFTLTSLDKIIEKAKASKYTLLDLNSAYCITTRVNNDTIIISIPDCDPESLSFRQFNLVDIIDDMSSLNDIILDLYRMPSIAPIHYSTVHIQNISNQSDIHSGLESLSRFDNESIYTLNQYLINAITHSNRLNFDSAMVSLRKMVPQLLHSVDDAAELVVVEYISLLGNAIVEQGFPFQQAIQVKKTLYRHLSSTNAKNLFLILKKICSTYFDTVQNFDSLNKLTMAEQINLYIMDNIRHKITLSDIAKKLNISLKRLNPTFKKTYHVTINQFIRHKKIEIAKNLLSSTSLSLQYISDSLGYSSKNYFIYEFKKITQMTPLDFREKMGRN